MNLFSDDQFKNLISSTTGGGDFAVTRVPSAGTYHLKLFNTINILPDASETRVYTFRNIQVNELANLSYIKNIKYDGLYYNDPSLLLQFGQKVPINEPLSSPCVAHLYTVQIGNSAELNGRSTQDQIILPQLPLNTDIKASTRCETASGMVWPLLDPVNFVKFRMIPIPQPPILTNPTQNSISLSNVDFTFNKVDYAISYRLYIVDTNRGTVIDTTFSSQNDTVSLTRNLIPGSSYKIALSSVYYNDPSHPKYITSDTVFFQTHASIASPILLSPAAGQILDTKDVPFAWQQVPNARQFRLQITNVSANTLALDSTVSATNLTKRLLSNTLYQYRVQALSGDTASAWSELRTFATGTATDAQAELREVSNVSVSSVGNRIHIRYSHLAGGIKVNVWDVLGRSIQHAEAGDPSSSLELRGDGWGAGVYVVHVQSRDGNERWSRTVVLR